MKLFKYHFLEKESDITIICESKSAIFEAKTYFLLLLKQLNDYISQHEEFLTSFSPLKLKSNLDIIQRMVDVSKMCEVGPMATIAGAFADLMVERMLSKGKITGTSLKVALVENGGEMMIQSEIPIKVALFAGFNELNLNMGFLIQPQDCPIGIGTSSSTFGHAVSLGQADSVTVFAETATLADGAATKIANSVKGDNIEQSIQKGLNTARAIEGVRGTFISRGNKIGQVGQLPKMFKIEGDKQEILKHKNQTGFLDDYEILG